MLPPELEAGRGPLVIAVFLPEAPVELVRQRRVAIPDRRSGRSEQWFSP